MATFTPESTPAPPHKLTESPNTRGIEIGDWQITTATNPIANALVLDELHNKLKLPLPEMTFANNYLLLEHKPSGWKYTFDAAHALAGVKNGPLEDGDGGVKVGHSEAWLKSRTDPSSNIPLPEAVVPTKPYDWTYTTLYSGHTEQGPSKEWQPADSSETTHTIPMAELTRPDPILYYAEVPIFDSELDDNGSSSLLVRIRVMPTCIFVLSRFCLRVDNVLFRIHDTRIYHSFASSPHLLIKETGGWEAPYNIIKQQLPRRNDVSPLTDPMFVGRAITALPEQVSRVRGAETGWRGLGSQTAILALS